MSEFWDEYIRKTDEHLSWLPLDVKGKELPTLRYLALAVCGETGELANKLKKEWRGDATDLERLKYELRRELADIINYSFMMATTLGIDDPIKLALAKYIEVETRPEWMKNMPSAPDWETDER